MANEIVAQNLGTSLDGYFQVWNAAGQVYNGSAFEAFNAPDWASQYALGQAAANAVGDYRANFPALAAGYYFVKVFACANGGTPTGPDGDQLALPDAFYWDGTQRIDRLSGVVVNSILPNAINAAAVANGAFTNTKFGAGAIDNTVLADGAVSAGKVADGAITSSKIADGALTSAKLADGVLTTAKLADNLLTSAKIADGAITNAKLADNLITAAKIADGALTAAKIVALPTAERNAIAAAVGALVIEAAEGIAPAFDLAAVMKQLLGYAVGKTQGMAGATGLILNPAGTKTRVTATLDGNGNRTPTAWDNS